MADHQILDKPASSRPEMTAYHLQPKPLWHSVEQQWSLGAEERSPTRTQPCRGLAHALQQRPGNRPRRVVKGHYWFASYQLNTRSGLVQQGCNIGCRGPRTYHRYVAAFESVETPMPRAMGYEFFGESGEYRRHILEVAYADRSYDSPSGYLFNVLKTYVEAGQRSAYRDDELILEFRNEPLLEFLSISCKGFQVDWKSQVGIRDSMLLTIPPQGERGIRIVKARCKPIGLKQHTLWHVRSPGMHGAAEDAKVDPTCLEMGGDRQPIRSGSDDGSINHSIGEIPDRDSGEMTYVRKGTAFTLSASEWRLLNVIILITLRVAKFQ